MAATLHPIRSADTEAGEDEILRTAEQILRKRIRTGEFFSDPSQVSAFLRTRLACKPDEEFHAVYLDTRHRMIEVVHHFTGTIDGAQVEPRAIARTALMLNAAAVICAHNHPSGHAEPSAADRAVTARLKQALALIDVRLLDHFVVTPDQALSMASRGWV